MTLEKRANGKVTKIFDLQRKRIILNNNKSLNIYLLPNDTNASIIVNKYIHTKNFSCKIYLHAIPLSFLFVSFFQDENFISLT